MRFTKFLIINGDSDRMMDDIANSVSSEVMRHIHLNEEPHLTVVECHHPKFEDNLVTVKDEWGDDINLLRSTSGLLFYYYDWWSKEEIINRFE